MGSLHFRSMKSANLQEGDSNSSEPSSYKGLIGFLLCES
jgi:hypothetical protein